MSKINMQKMVAGVRRLALSAVVACASAAGFCDLSVDTSTYTPIDASSGPVVPGEWNSGVAAGKAYADANNMPMLAIFGSKFCSHCHALQTACNTDEFKAWAAEKRIVMVFGMDSETKKFCKPDDSTSLPFVAVYWPKSDGTTVYVRFTGMLGYMPSKEGDTLSAQLINSCNMYIGAYPMLDGVECIAFTNVQASARLEAVAGRTTYVDVPLARDSFLAGRPSTNRFTAVCGGAQLMDETVVWDPASVAMYVRVPIAADAAPGDEIDVALKSMSGEDRGSTKIFVVGERENSTKDPLFIGERTADTLQYGEWTMDLDVAMEKYRKEPESRLMVIASGALWCPDCVMTDEHVLETEDFKKWAVDNKVILVDIDVPNFGPREGSSACLLTRVAVRVSDGYVSGRGTLATNELERYQSGAGYISRHMVSDADAAKVLARNRSLVGRNTLQGGWNNPERANQDRTGIPNFFALRRDGSLAGTFETFDAIGPSGYNAAYLARFSELIALGQSDDDKLSNRSWQTTKDVYAGAGDSAGAVLTPLDLIDTYRLAPTADAATEQTVTVRGSDSAAVATVSIIAVIDGEKQTLATAKGRIADGVSATGVIASSGEYYVVVEGEASGLLAADSSVANASVAYTLGGSRRKIENPFTNEWTAKAASATLPLYAKGGDSLAGTLALTLKKNGKVTAKYSDGKRVVASFSGKWDADVSIDGTATAVLAKKNGSTLRLAMSGDGVASAEVVAGGKTLVSGDCALAEDYGDIVGNYAACLPSTAASASGTAYMTLSMASGKAAATKGKVKFAVFLPDGSKLSGNTGVSVYDANFLLVPVIKAKGDNSVSAAVLVRRLAGRAATRRAVMSAPGVRAVLRNGGASDGCEIYGSVVVAGESLAKAAGGATSVAFVPDASGVQGSAYGALEGIVFDGGKLNVAPGGIAPAESVKGFSFRLDRRTGVFKGKTSLRFSGKAKVSAKFGGVILPDWYSDCECQEDDDTIVPMEFLPFGVGGCVYTDSVGGRRMKRSIPLSLGVDARGE